MSWIEDPGLAIFKGFNISELRMDEAYLSILNQVVATPIIWLYELSPDCHNCPYQRLDSITKDDPLTLVVHTRVTPKYLLRTSGDDEFVPRHENPSDNLCAVEEQLGEFGVYTLEVKGRDNCNLITELSPVNIYYPLLIVSIFYIVLLTLLYVVNKFHSRIFWFLGKKEPPQNGDQVANGNTEGRQRVKSLDAFRGLSILLMIFVNSGGGGYWFFDHAIWDGLLIADLVFPWFVWIMGVCIPMSIVSQKKKGIPSTTVLMRVGIRSCKLILLGIFLLSAWVSKDINTIRLPGVLQRFGVCYFVCSIVLWFTVDEVKKQENAVKGALEDLRVLWRGWCVILIIALLWFLLTFFLHDKDCPKGYLGPGGIHNYRSDHVIPGHCIGGAAGYIDRKVFTTRHLYPWTGATDLYHVNVPFDPEGLLGTLPSIIQVWVGVQTGIIMMVYKDPKQRLVRWMFWAILTGVIGGALCEFKETDGWIPVNKNLWSLSFALVTTSFALVLLSIFYFLIDIMKWWSGTPFFESGMNSILLYVGQELCSSMLPFRYSYGPMRTHFANLIENAWAVTVWALVGIYFHNKKKYFVI